MRTATSSLTPGDRIWIRLGDSNNVLAAKKSRRDAQEVAVVGLEPLTSHAQPPRARFRLRVQSAAGVQYAGVFDGTDTHAVAQ